MVLVGFTRAAAAEDAPDARTERLSGLSADALRRLEPFTASGPVALVEFANTDADELPAINVLSRIQAPIGVVLDVVASPTAYPKFLRTLDRVKAISKQPGTLVYDWAWDLSVFRLRGRNIMRVYQAPKGSERRGHRITIDSVSGDFGAGRMSIRLLPRGERETLMILSMRLDLREANYVARQAAKAARSVNRSANMALAYAMTFGFAHEAQKRVGTLAEKHPPIALHKPSVPNGVIFPLLMTGDVVLLNMNGETLSQVAIYGRINLPRAEVRNTLLNAQDFGAALVPGSEADVVAQQGQTTTFDWDIDIPLLGVSGRMDMVAGDPVVSVEATKGAMAGGKWCFETLAVGPGVTMVSSWAQFDVSNTNFLVRAITGADPYLGHGISAASQVMLVRAIRTRAHERIAEQQKAAAQAVTASRAQ